MLASYYHPRNIDYSGWSSSIKKQIDLSNSNFRSPKDIQYSDWESIQHQQNQYQILDNEAKNHQGYKPRKKRGTDNRVHIHQNQNHKRKNNSILNDFNEEGGKNRVKRQTGIIINMILFKINFIRTLTT